MTPEDSLLRLNLPNAITGRWIEQLREPHRHYHNRSHIDQMLRDLPATKQSREMIAAIWLHDIVYDPKASDNEERSADQAAMDLAGSDIRVGKVQRLIMATKTHIADYHVQRILNDLDLSILGHPPMAYQRYAQQIRAEYAHVDTPAYRAGRIQVLESFHRGTIFQTAAFRHLEVQAHQNLSREIESLKDGTGVRTIGSA